MTTAPSAFTAQHTNPMSWEEFHSIVDALIAQLGAYARPHGITFDAVAPLLRSGAIPATMIANKMQIVPMVPVQLKYDYKTRVTDLKLAPSLPKGLSRDAVHHIIVVDCRTESGNSAREAARVLKELLPRAQLHFVSVIKTHGGPVVIEGYAAQYIGRYTSEGQAGADDASLRPGITIFPWETTAFELADINAPLNDID